MYSLRMHEVWYSIMFQCLSHLILLGRIISKDLCRARADSFNLDESLQYWWIIHVKVTWILLGRSYIESKISVPIIYLCWRCQFELVGFKNADWSIAFSMGSALLSWCSNRQLFSHPLKKGIRHLISPLLDVNSW